MTEYQEWKAKFGIPPAKNNGYRTHNVAVPHEVLFPAIGGALRVLFTPAKSAQQTFEVAA